MFASLVVQKLAQSELLQSCHVDDLSHIPDRAVSVPAKAKDFQTMPEQDKDFMETLAGMSVIPIWYALIGVAYCRPVQSCKYIAALP